MWKLSNLYRREFVLDGLDGKFASVEPAHVAVLGGPCCDLTVVEGLLRAPLHQGEETSRLFVGEASILGGRISQWCVCLKE